MNWQEIGVFWMAVSILAIVIYASVHEVLEAWAIYRRRKWEKEVCEFRGHAAQNEIELWGAIVDPDTLDHINICRKHDRDLTRTHFKILSNDYDPEGSLKSPPPPRRYPPLPDPVIKEKF